MTVGLQTGVFDSWSVFCNTALLAKVLIFPVTTRPKCQEQVNGVSGNCYIGHKTHKDAVAAYEEDLRGGRVKCVF